MPAPGAELERLTALRNMMILDTPAEREFDDITKLAAESFDAEVSTVSLVDEHRVWFKSSVGLNVAETLREHAICALGLNDVEPLVIHDMSADERLADNPHVRNDNGFRFYAGVPLILPNGHSLGNLCVLDRRPRAAIAVEQMTSLVDLAARVVNLIEARRYRQIGEIAAQVLDVTSDAVLCSDCRGRITFWNRGAERMFGHTAAQVLGQSLDMIVPKRLLAEYHSGFANALSGSLPHALGESVELIAIREDGSEFCIELSFGRWGDAQTGQGFAGIIRDISVRKALQQERLQAKAFLDTVIDHLPAMLFVKDVATRKYLLINRAGEELTGVKIADVIGRTDRELFARGAEYEERDAIATSTDGVSQLETEFHRVDGTVSTLRTKRIAFDGPDMPRQYILGMSEDVTETRLAQAEVLRLAHYDALTGLRNRGSCAEMMEEMIQSGQSFALLSIDLDRFKSVNDQHGHPAGDEVLARIGERFRQTSGSGDVLARVGGDEFVMLLPDCEVGGRARVAAGSILAALAAPVSTKWATVQLGASIGITLFPNDAKSIDGLRQCADLALYRAKREGRGSICFFSAEMDAAARDRRLLEKDLRNAIAQDAITLKYQPVISVATGQITSAEALARWTHPVRGAIAPDLFISIAEESGMIEELGAHILGVACADAMTWPSAIFVAVNVSPIQVHSERFCETVRDALARSGLPAGRLQLEVTESLFLGDVDHTFGQLEQLRSLGIQVLMDDFGVGYSSLSYFERFTFDKVKIDKSFVQGMLHSRASRAIIQAVAGLGAALEMSVVAEGVETQEQLEELVAVGCTHLQGFLFSRPVDRHQIACLLDPTISTFPVEHRGRTLASG